MGGGEPTDAAADDDQVVGFARVFGLARRVPERAVAQAMGGIERSGMAASHASESGGIVVGRSFWTGGGRTIKTGSGEIPRHHGRARRHRNAVEEVPARDLAMHPQFPVP